MHLRAPSPSSRSWGRGAALDSPPSPPGAERGRRGGVSREVKGLTFWACSQQGQTPNTHPWKESAEPYSGLPALPTGRREAREKSARWGGGLGGDRVRAGGRQPGLSSRRAHRPRPRSPRRPLLQLPKAKQSYGPEGSGAGARRGPGSCPLPVPPRPLAASSQPQPPLGPKSRGTGRRRGSHLCSARRLPRRGAHQPWGSRGSLAAEPRLMLRREVAASPAAGGGCTGTRRGGEGARRPGPCSRGPARGGHLEARRRSRGTTGGGSGGDGSSST